MTDKRKRGRPATGQNTTVIRVATDFDKEIAYKLYYDWLPIINRYREIAEDRKSSPRSQLLRELLEELT